MKILQKLEHMEEELSADYRNISNQNNKILIRCLTQYFNY
jgi:hypothetical protein